MYATNGSPQQMMGAHPPSPGMGAGASGVGGNMEFGPSPADQGMLGCAFF